MDTLPETQERRPLHTDGAPDTTSATPTIADPADVAALLELSDERDQWQRACLERERQAYECGRRDGIETGRRMEAAERDEAWNRVAKPIARGGPTHAELQRRRQEVA